MFCVHSAPPSFYSRKPDGPATTIAIATAGLVALIAFVAAACYYYRRQESKLKEHQRWQQQQQQTNPERGRSSAVADARTAGRIRPTFHAPCVPRGLSVLLSVTVLLPRACVALGPRQRRRPLYPETLATVCCRGDEIPGNFFSLEISGEPNERRVNHDALEVQHANHWARYFFFLHI